MIHYAIEREISVDQFRDLLVRSTLGERRPIDAESTLAGMLAHADLLVTAWEGELLVGVARSVTDFHYCCYLSDLAVDREFQRRGIGKRLIEKTRERLGDHCHLVLLSAPAAVSYYPAVGFTRHEQAWTLPPKSETGKLE